MITIKKVESKKELKEYVLFPFELYKNDKNWVPPLINDELATFDKDKNPAFETAECHLFLAYKESKIVGRIAAIINWNEVNIQNKKKIRFGWWDVINDIEVTQKLLEKVIEIGKTNQLEHMEGPMGFSNLDKVGVVTDGFDSIGSMITWYNFPYYKEHLEQLGFQIEKEYVENKMLFSNIKPDFFYKAQELIKKRYELTPLNFTKTKDLMPYVDKMFDLFNESYSSLSSFVAITDIQKEYFKKKYISFINPEYIKFVLDKNQNMIAFGIVMPSFGTALQKANGKLFPFGLFHLLKAKKESKEVLFYLIGVHPDYQSKGVTAVVFNEFYNTFLKKGIEVCVRTPELEDNIAIQQIWKHFQPQIFRKRKTYIKTL